MWLDYLHIFLYKYSTSYIYIDIHIETKPQCFTCILHANITITNGAILYTLNSIVDKSKQQLDQMICEFCTI